MVRLRKLHLVVVTSDECHHHVLHASALLVCAHIDSCGDVRRKTGVKSLSDFKKNKKEPNNNPCRSVDEIQNKCCLLK